MERVEVGEHSEMTYCLYCGGPVDTGGNCPTCSRWVQPPPVRLEPTPKGCICPPTSEMTCQAANCPRRGP